MALLDYPRLWIFRYKVTEVGADGKRRLRLGCMKEIRQPSTNQRFGYSVFFHLPHLPYVTSDLRLERIVKIPRTREAHRLQTKGKKN